VIVLGSSRNTATATPSAGETSPRKALTFLPDAALDDRFVSHELVQPPPLLADQILLARG
jgi:hypothetical protein